MSNTQGTAIIRERGQLTIPDSIRKLVDWISPSSPVSISVIKPDEILIKPHGSLQKVDWDLLSKDIKNLNSYPVRGTMSEFIAWDREHGHE